MRRVLAALVVAVMAGASPAAPPPHVYVVVVDGLDARLALPERMPRLFALVAAGPAGDGRFGEARAVMPARTNPNHVSLLTATYPAAHGITGNSYWSRSAEARPARLDAASLVEVETLFTVIETTAPARVTLGVFGKPKLGRLFGEAAGRQRAPDVLWSPERLPAERRDRATGYSIDADTMEAALARTAEHEPDLAVVNLADVDRTAHAYGPDSAECAAAVAGADQAVARLVDDLRTRGRWERAVLLVTADHGFTSLIPTAAGPPPVITLERRLGAGLAGVRVVADGGVEHVYAEGLAPEATSVGTAADRLARMAVLAATTPGVAEVVARLPVPGVPLLADAHPDWRLVHPRTGELLLIAAPGHQFVDPWDPIDAALLGNHGAPGELRVPFVVSGGWPAAGAPPAGAPPPTLADVGATVAQLLGVRPPRRVDGTPVPPDLAGVPMADPRLRPGSGL